MKIQLGSKYFIIAGNNDDYINFVTDRNVEQFTYYLHDEDQVKELRKGTIIYKGYNYVESAILQSDILRIRVMLGELSFRDWID